MWWEIVALSSFVGSIISPSIYCPFFFLNKKSTCCQASNSSQKLIVGLTYDFSNNKIRLVINNLFDLDNNN